VTGLPETRKDHAVAMARFARDCMHRTQVLLPKLEVTLGTMDSTCIHSPIRRRCLTLWCFFPIKGPDTADLAMRMGKCHRGSIWQDEYGTSFSTLLNRQSFSTSIRYALRPGDGGSLARRSQSIPALWRYHEHGGPNGKHRIALQNSNLPGNSGFARCGWKDKLDTAARGW
jgi:hypothetical protein